MKYVGRKLSVLVTVAVLTSQAHAENVIYHRDSDAYFELVYKRAAVDANRITWPTAAERAAKMSRHGRSGRLAIIDTLDKHEFVRENFEIRLPTWIGLRYWCSSRMLAWVNGAIHADTAFQRWAIPWHRTHIRCGKNKIPYMPVYYTEGTQWQASGSAKKFRSFLVEYPPPTSEMIGKRKNTEQSQK